MPSVQRFGLGSIKDAAAGYLKNSFDEGIYGAKYKQKYGQKPEQNQEPSNAEIRKLAARLYPYISQKLKGELGRDRERTGMITGLHR